MLNDEILRQIKDAEQKYKINDYKGNSACVCAVKQYGELPILLSAPHAVKQIRSGAIKSHEFYTGSIVECLAKQVGCACITKSYLAENTANDDPNTDDASCAYKIAVHQFLQKHKIKLFVDIHGLSAKRNSVVDICINGGKNVNNPAYAAELQKYIEQKFGAGSCSVDKYYSAASDNVMSKWVYRVFGISAVELEINGAYRWFDGDTEGQSVDLFLCLAQWLKNIPFKW